MPNAVVEKLLIAVAEIKRDVFWLKRAFWALVTAGLSFNVLLVVAIITYLLNHK